MKKRSKADKQWLKGYLEEEEEESSLQIDKQRAEEEKHEHYKRMNKEKWKPFKCGHIEE